MILTSSAFENHQSIPRQYTKDGENIHPPLLFSGIPENTKSLTLIVTDPDAPMGTWIHWLVWNMPVDTKVIPEGVTPSGTEGITSYGTTGYGGPYPPSGTHRYFFTLYALDTLLTLDAKARIEALKNAMEGHVLSQAELVGIYSRE